MSFDTSWDVDKYKNDFECEEHWQLRRNFLIAHKDKYPEDRLICLAQVFFNIELLGCKYPEKVMTLVSELSEGVADSYRKAKESKLQRTFVKASDVAGAKVKGNNFNSKSISSSRIQFTVARENLSTCGIGFNNSSIDSNKQQENLRNTVQFQSTNNQPFDFNSSQLVVNNKPATKFTNRADFNFNKVPPTFAGAIYSSSSNIKDVYGPTCHPFTNTVLMVNMSDNFLEDGQNILQRMFAQHQPLDRFEYSFEKLNKIEEQWECVISYRGKIIGKAIANTKAIARKAANAAFLNGLQEMCYTVVEKVKYLGDGSMIEKSSKMEEQSPAVTSESIGTKMLKQMGWKGGGLGVNEQGISEPVMVRQQIQRQGFGSGITVSELLKQIKSKLETYAVTFSNYDMVFSTDFSKEERALIHKMAQVLHLSSKSYGPQHSRQLVVSKKKMGHFDIVDELLRCGGENERYILINPKSS